MNRIGEEWIGSAIFYTRTVKQDQFVRKYHRLVCIAEFCCLHWFRHCEDCVSSEWNWIFKYDGVLFAQEARWGGWSKPGKVPPSPQPPLNNDGLHGGVSTSRNVNFFQFIFFAQHSLNIKKWIKCSLLLFLLSLFWIGVFITVTPRRMAENVTASTEKNCPLSWSPIFLEFMSSGLYLFLDPPLFRGGCWSNDASGILTVIAWK